MTEDKRVVNAHSTTTIDKLPAGQIYQMYAPKYTSNFRITGFNQLLIN